MPEPVAPWFDASIVAPRGTSDWRFTAIDRGLQSHSVNTRVTVEDTTPPTVTLENDLCLWPANHKYVVLDAEHDLLRTTEDRCDEHPSVRIVDVTSSEPDDGSGDGSTGADIVLVDEKHVCLRAERSGRGEGRTYTVTLEVSDAAGNRRTVTQHVMVPHDQSRHRCNTRSCGHHVNDDDLECQRRSTPSPSRTEARHPPHGCDVAPALMFGLGALLLLLCRRSAP